MTDVVLDPTLPAANQGLASLDVLAAQAFALEPPPPSELKDLMRNEAGLLLDGLLVRVARGRGALDVAIGEGSGARRPRGGREERRDHPSGGRHSARTARNGPPMMAMATESAIQG